MNLPLNLSHSSKKDSSNKYIKKIIKLGKIAQER